MKELRKIIEPIDFLNHIEGPKVDRHHKNNALSQAKDRKQQLANANKFERNNTAQKR